MFKTKPYTKFRLHLSIQQFYTFRKNNLIDWRQICICTFNQAELAISAASYQLRRRPPCAEGWRYDLDGRPNAPDLLTRYNSASCWYKIKLTNINFEEQFSLDLEVVIRGKSFSYYFHNLYGILFINHEDWEKTYY